MAGHASRVDVWEARNSITEMTTRLLGPGFHNFDFRRYWSYVDVNINSNTKPLNEKSKKQIIIFTIFVGGLSGGFAWYISRKQNEDIQNMLNKKMLQSIRAMIREELASPMGENTDDEDNDADDKNNNNQDQNDYSKKKSLNHFKRPYPLKQ